MISTCRSGAYLRYCEESAGAIPAVAQMKSFARLETSKDCRNKSLSGWQYIRESSSRPEGSAKLFCCLWVRAVGALFKGPVREGGFAFIRQLAKEGFCYKMRSSNEVVSKANTHFIDWSHVRRGKRSFCQA